MASELFKKLVAKRPQTVLLPGGNSPKVFFNKLINYDINWDNISLLASDERIVPLNSNNSNTGMIQRELLDRIIEKEKLCRKVTNVPRGKTLLFLLHAFTLKK